MMENVSEDSRLLLARVCCLGLGFKLQTWLCGGENLKKKGSPKFSGVASSDRNFYRKPGYVAGLVLGLWH